MTRRGGATLVAPPTATVGDCVRRGDATWHSAYPAVTLEPPRDGRKPLPDLPGYALPAAWPEFGVVELASGSIFGRHGWAIGRDGCFLPQLSWYGGPDERMRVPDPLPPPRAVEGTCLSLVSDWSCRNYSHFLLDGLGRMALFLEAGFSLDDVDHVYCPTPPSATAARLLDRLGIPHHKRISAAPGLLLQAERLLVPSLPAAQLAYPPWLPAFFRRLLEPVGDAPVSRRLYVSRRGYGRHARQEREVEELVLARGFEIYDAAADASRPEDFDHSEFVVGAHGAGLANLVFCRPGTHVVEIVPTDNAHPFYYSLAVGGDLDYRVLPGTSSGRRPAGSFGPSPYDFDVDLRVLAELLAAAGRAPETTER